MKIVGAKLTAADKKKCLFSILVTVIKSETWIVSVNIFHLCSIFILGRFRVFVALLWITYFRTIDITRFL